MNQDAPNDTLSVENYGMSTSPNVTKKEDINFNQ